MRQKCEPALLALLRGASVTDAARAAGVNRTTVHRWLRDPAFLAEVNARRNEAARAARDRLRTLVGGALDAVEGALTRADDPKLRARVALEVLEGVGLLGTHAVDIGESLDEDPDGIGEWADLG